MTQKHEDWITMETLYVDFTFNVFSRMYVTIDLEKSSIPHHDSNRYGSPTAPGTGANGE